MATKHVDAMLAERVAMTSVLAYGCFLSLTKTVETVHHCHRYQQNLPQRPVLFLHLYPVRRLLVLLLLRVSTVVLITNLKVRKIGITTVE